MSQPKLWNAKRFVSAGTENAKGLFRERNFCMIVFCDHCKLISRLFDRWGDFFGSNVKCKFMLTAGNVKKIKCVNLFTWFQFFVFKVYLSRCKNKLLVSLVSHWRRNLTLCKLILWFLSWFDSHLMAHSQIILKSRVKILISEASWSVFLLVGASDFWNCRRFDDSGWRVYKKQEKRRLGPDGRVLYVPLNGCSLSRSPFSGSPWELPTTAGEEIWGSVSLLLLFIFFNIVACMKFQI